MAVAAPESWLGLGSTNLYFHALIPIAGDHEVDFPIAASFPRFRSRERGHFPCHGYQYDDRASLYLDLKHDFDLESTGCLSLDYSNGLSLYPSRSNSAGWVYLQWPSHASMLSTCDL